MNVFHIGKAYILYKKHDNFVLKEGIYNDFTRWMCFNIHKALITLHIKFISSR